MKHWVIDINADLGEGAGFDKQLMPLVSSCNIACGGHYGTIETMEQAVRLAKKYNVKIGAHPSFPDTDNFGRQILTMTKSELTESVFHQLLQFYTVCETENAPIHHIKLHGALYNFAAKDAPTADAVIAAIVQTKVRPKLYVPYGSILHKKAENLLPLMFEAFIDRGYHNDGSLMSRNLPTAVIEEPVKAWKQLLEMITSKSVDSFEGDKTSITANTFCIHGDNEQSVPILEYIHSKMTSHSISLSFE